MKTNTLCFQRIGILIQVLSWRQQKHQRFFDELFDVIIDNLFFDVVKRLLLKLCFRRNNVLGCPELACWQISMLEAETGAWYPHHWSGVERDFGVGHWQHPTLIVVSIWIRLGSLFVCFFACFIGRQTLQEDFVIQTK